MDTRSVRNDTKYKGERAKHAGCMHKNTPHGSQHTMGCGQLGKAGHLAACYWVRWVVVFRPLSPFVPWLLGSARFLHNSSIHNAARKVLRSRYGCATCICMLIPAYGKALAVVHGRVAQVRPVSPAQPPKRELRLVHHGSNDPSGAADGPVRKVFVITVHRGRRHHPRHRQQY